MLLYHGGSRHNKRGQTTTGGTIGRERSHQNKLSITKSAYRNTTPRLNGEEINRATLKIRTRLCMETNDDVGSQ